MNNLYMKKIEKKIKNIFKKNCDESLATATHVLVQNTSASTDNNKNDKCDIVMDNLFYDGLSFVPNNVKAIVTCTVCQKKKALTQCTPIILDYGNFIYCYLCQSCKN